jgi:cytochrome c556
MLLGMVWAFTGCGAVATEQDQRELTDKVQEVQTRMHERYAASRHIQVAIAFGDLDGARRGARAIASVYEPALLPQWQPYLTQLRAAAQQVVVAPDLATAARMSALLGLRCAQCHDATRAKVVFEAAPSVAQNPRLASQMASHERAAMLMWEGLSGSVPARFESGARALVDAPIAIVAESDNLPPDLAAADDVQRLHLYARRALDAKTADERATTYGDVLVTCTGCHRTMRGQ